MEHDDPTPRSSSSRSGPWWTLALLAAVVLGLRWSFTPRPADLQRSIAPPPGDLAAGGQSAGVTAGERGRPGARALRSSPSPTALRPGATAIRQTDYVYGRIVSLQGENLAGVEVRLGDHRTISHIDGTFWLPRATGPLGFHHAEFHPAWFEGPLPTLTRAANSPEILRQVRQRLSARSVATRGASHTLIPGLRVRGTVVSSAIASDSGRETSGGAIDGAVLRFRQHGRVLRHIRSDRTGHYESPLLEPGPVEITVSHPDFLLAMTELELDDPSQPAERDFRLSTGVPFVISASDERGTPIREVALWETPRQGDRRLLGWTDELGTLRGQRGGHPESTWWVEAVGYRRQRMPARSSGVRLTLQRAPVLSLVAVEARSGLSVPIRGATYRRLIESPPGPRTAEHRARFIPASYRELEPGRVEIESPIHQGRYQLSVSTPIGTAESAPIEVELPGKAPQPTELVVSVHATLSISGRVAGGGRPRPESRVSLFRLGDAPDGDGAQEYTAEVKPDGGFGIRDLPPGQFLITARAPGFADFISAPIRLSVGTAVARLPILLEQGSTVRGRVVSAAGPNRPEGTLAARHRLRLIPDPVSDAAASALPPRETWSDADGDFAFENIRGGCRYRVLVDEETSSRVASPPRRLIDVPRDRDVYYRLRLSPATK